MKLSGKLDFKTDDYGRISCDFIVTSAGPSIIGIDGMEQLHISVSCMNNSSSSSTSSLHASETKKVLLQCDVCATTKGSLFYNTKSTTPMLFGLPASKLRIPRKARSKLCSYVRQRKEDTVSQCGR